MAGPRLLKKEIRVLGLSSQRLRSSETLFVGVVFRGCLWLDGAFSCVLENKQRTFEAKLARAVMSCKQYQQLHAAIFHENEVPLTKTALTRLRQRITLPIIIIAKKKRLDPAEGCVYVEGGSSISLLPYGMSCDRARAIFAVTCARGSRVPEAVRVAELLSAAMIGMRTKQTILRNY